MLIEYIDFDGALDSRCAGPIVEFVTNLALHSGEIEEHHDGEETGSGDQGKVTLTTIHSCKGMVPLLDRAKTSFFLPQDLYILCTLCTCLQHAGLEWPVVFVVKWQHGVLISSYRNAGELDAFNQDETQLAR